MISKVGKPTAGSTKYLTAITFGEGPRARSPPGRFPGEVRRMRSSPSAWVPSCGATRKLQLRLPPPPPPPCASPALAVRAGPAGRGGGTRRRCHPPPPLLLLFQLPLPPPLPRLSPLAVRRLQVCSPRPAARARRRRSCPGLLAPLPRWRRAPAGRRLRS